MGQLSKDRFAQLAKTLSELAKILSSAGYGIESAKVVNEPLLSNPKGSFRGIKLKISRKASMANLFSKPFSADSLLKLSEAISSFGYDINSLKTVRKPWGFKRIKLRISDSDETF
jgi:hypothetical protein